MEYIFQHVMFRHDNSIDSSRKCISEFVVCMINIYSKINNDVKSNVVQINIICTNWLSLRFIKYVSKPNI